MRKIATRPPNGTFRLPQMETAPVPIGPLGPVGQPDVGELPPPPPQMNAPVGPPPPVADLPTDYEGYVELCKTVSRGAMSDKALIWANLAQADALDRSARALAGLLEIARAPEPEVKTRKSPKRPDPRRHPEEKP